MTTLAAVLVRQRALPLETVEQAMLRQSLFGGDLATNLLELASIDEPALLLATAAALEAEAMPSGRIAVESLEELRAFDVAQLLDLPFLPLRITETAVLVAVSSPLPTVVESELRERFGKPVVLRAALEVRIRQAIADALGQRLDERTLKLLARLDGVPFTSDQSETSAGTASGVPTPRVSVPVIGRRSLIPTRRDSKPHGQARRLGPFTAAMAEIELTSAQSPGDIIAVWLDFVAQYFDYSAIFAVQGDLAAGKVARGAGTIGEAFSRIGVPLDLPSVLQRVRVAGTWQLTELEPRGLDRSLARDLGRTTGRQVLVVPICIKQRVVLLTYGDHGSEDVLLDRVGDVLALQPLIERHLERLLVERKRGGKSLQPLGTRSQPAQRETPASLRLRAAGRTDSTTESSASASTASGSAAIDQPQSEPATIENAEVAAATASVEHLQPVALTTDLQGPSAAASAVDASEPPSPRDQHEASNAAVYAGVDTDAIDESWDLIQPVLSVGGSDAARTTRAATNQPSQQKRESSPPGSVWPSMGTRPGLSPKLELVTDSDAAFTSVPTPPPPPPILDPPLLPATRAEAHAPHAPVRASESLEMALPSVLVDSERDCLELFERFKRGEASALESLLELGDAAIGVLVQQLPGPIVTPSRAPRTDQATKASECGPVLKALAAFGPAARPFVIARTGDSDSKVRVWSTRLLGELVGRSAAIAVAQRIVLDRDAEVRRAAYLASHQLLRDPDSAQALRDALLTTASDRQAVITHRLAAIDAIADLRDAPAIPNLIELLADPNPGTAAAAQQALTVLARQDFGYDARTWSSWWQGNSTRDRIEWVIDALDHRSPAIRQAASEELRLISRLYVGNFDDDSTETRARVQKKYRDWWASGARSPSGPARS